MEKINDILTVGSVYSSDFPVLVDKKIDEHLPMRVYFIIDEISATLIDDEEWEDFKGYSNDETLRNKEGLLDYIKYEISINWRTTLYADMESDEYEAVSSYISDNFKLLTDSNEKEIALSEIEKVGKCNRDYYEAHSEPRDMH